ncbi:hypothetical protein [Argonema antarcticum]|uniref:hypothetical protein n=1 Tax=Argonema antarcticum TaxID=2942763 RepID=UPI002012C615|nr:hypothetical protein [Argonema antarcticum]MCL1474394.1 hypothetical protein [Argonema antarcticum A004/B2]
MLPFRKKIVTDESMRPVAVLIDYEDWQKIEQLLEACKVVQKEEFNIAKYAGVIKLTEDPLKYQQRIRDEW